MRKLACFLAVAMLIGLAPAALPSAAAAELKPVSVVSFAGYNRLIAGVEMVSKLIGKPDAAQGIEGMIAMMTGGKGLAGLDKDAPWGIMELPKEDTGMPTMPTMIGFLPLADVKQQLELLKAQPSLSVKEADGAFEISVPFPPITAVVIQRGSWAYFSTNKSAFGKAELEKLPSDPRELLGDLPKKYLFAEQVNFKNTPPKALEEQFSNMQKMLPLFVRHEPNETEEMYALKLKSAETTLKVMQAIIKDLDQMQIGMNLDPQTNQILADVEFTPKAGSTLARQAAEMKTAKTDFAGFDLPGAAITVHKTFPIIDAYAAPLKTALENVRSLIEDEVRKQDLSDKEAQLAEGLVKDAFDAMIQTVEAKKIDGGAVIKADDKTLFAAAGMAVADGKKIEGIIEKLAAVAKDEGVEGADQFKLNAQAYKGIRFHTLSLPTPDEQLKPLVGDTLEIILGVGDTQAYVAAGSDAEKNLKEIIDQSQAQAGKSVPPFELKLALAPLMKFLAATAPEHAKGPLQMIATLMEQSSGKDHVNVTMQSTETGLRLRLEVEEGVIKALGMTIMTISMPRGMPMPPAPGGNPFSD